MNGTVELPTRTTERSMTFHSLRLDAMKMDTMYLRKNQVELHDLWYQSFGFPSFTGQFYDIVDAVESSYINRVAMF